MREGGRKGCGGYQGKPSLGYLKVASHQLPACFKPGLKLVMTNCRSSHIGIPNLRIHLGFFALACHKNG